MCTMPEEINQWSDRFLSDQTIIDIWSIQLSFLCELFSKFKRINHLMSGYNKLNLLVFSFFTNLSLNGLLLFPLETICCEYSCLTVGNKPGKASVWRTREEFLILFLIFIYSPLFSLIFFPLLVLLLFLLLSLIIMMMMIHTLFTLSVLISLSVTYLNKHNF